MSKVPLNKMAENSLLEKRIFEYEGHKYVLLSNSYDKKSRYAETTVDPGFYAAFNISSHTVRGIRANTYVEMSRDKINAPASRPVRKPLKKKAPNSVSLTVITPEEIELRSEPANNLALNKVQRAISDYITDVSRDWSWDDDDPDQPEAPEKGQVEVDYVLPDAVVKFLGDKGYTCLVLTETKSNDVFYPPTKTVECGTRISWNR